MQYYLKINQYKYLHPVVVIWWTNILHCVISLKWEIKRWAPTASKSKARALCDTHCPIVGKLPYGQTRGLQMFAQHAQNTWHDSDLVSSGEDIHGDSGLPSQQSNQLLLLEYMNTWVHNYLSTWILGNSNTWVHEYFSPWLLEYMNTWVHEYLSTVLLEYLFT